MAGGADEVQAGVHTEVDLVLAARLLLLEHVGFMLIVEELDDGHPRIAVVDVIAKARGVDHGEADWVLVSGGSGKESKKSSRLRVTARTFEELLLQLGLGDLDLDRLVDLLLMPALVVGIVLDGGGEQRVDEGRLAQPGLASDLIRG